MVRDVFAHLTVLLILLQNEFLVCLYGVCNLVQQVASILAGKGLQGPGGVPGLDGQLPAAVGGLLRGFWICTKGRSIPVLPFQTGGVVQGQSGSAFSARWWTLCPACV